MARALARLAAGPLQIWPAEVHHQPAECAVLPSNRSTSFADGTVRSPRQLLTGAGSSGSANPAQPPDAALPTT